MMQREILICILSITYFVSGIHADKRPFYIIAHMVNSVRQVKHYLDRGANALESDIMFHPNGSVSQLFHGFPCDCFRTCHRSAKMPEYMEHVREITDPKNPDTYYNKMLLQMLDLKLSTSNNKRASGRDLARHVLDHLWTKDSSRKQEVRVVFYFEYASESDVLLGIMDEFKSRGQEKRLKDVGFDGGMGNLFDIQRMFSQLGVNGNVWQGDGRTNCISALAPDGRLRRAVLIRDSRKSYIAKVYHWTIDLKLRMRVSLNVGVDAMITNDPEDLLEVLQESYYEPDYRLATVDDDPFSRYVPRKRRRRKRKVSLSNRDLTGFIYKIK